MNTDQRSIVDHQLDQAWLEWLAAKDSHLYTFFTVDVPDMPDRPYSVAGLHHAESALLLGFPSLESVPLGDWVIDRFGVYLGQVFIENAAGRWINEPDHGFAQPRPKIMLPGSDRKICVRSQVTMALHRRTARVWTDAFSVATTRRPTVLQPPATPGSARTPTPSRPMSVFTSTRRPQRYTEPWT